MARDYKAEYKRRAEKARREGFTSPREKVAYTRVKKSRTKRLTIYNYRKMRDAQRAKAKAERTKNTVGARTKIFKQYKITLDKFNKIRAANRAFDKKTKSPRLLYNLQLDADTNNWSNERVGYILGYYTVFVKPETKKLARGGKTRQNLVNKYNEVIESFDLFADYQDLTPFKYEREKLA